MQFTVWAWKKKTTTFTVTAFTLLSQISFGNHILPGLCVHWSNCQAFQFSRRRGPLLVYHAHRLRPSPACSWSKAAGPLRKQQQKPLCGSQDNLLQGLLPKGSMDKTTPILSPSAYTEFSNIFPANFASSDNPACL